MSLSHTEESFGWRCECTSDRCQARDSDRDHKPCAPVLHPALLARIHQLNLDYLELLVAERDAADGSTQLQYLPPRQRVALGALSPRALRALAAMPYSLYSLGFEDENFWNAVCESAMSSASALAVQRYARVGDASAQCSFCELALMQAWHVAGKNTMAARMLYAMPHATARRLVNTPLWQIRCIAGSYGELMMPRWPTNPAFWPDLIRFAASERRSPTAHHSLARHSAHRRRVGSVVRNLSPTPAHRPRVSFASATCEEVADGASCFVG